MDDGVVGHVIGRFGLNWAQFVFFTLYRKDEGVDSLVTGFPVVNPSSIQYQSARQPGQAQSLEKLVAGTAEV